MSKVGVIYLQPNNRYRKAQAETGVLSLGSIVNRSDHQWHTLSDSPVFYPGGVPRFETWEELLNAEPPLPDHHTDRAFCLCEDDNPWPLSLKEEPDLLDRQLQYEEFSNASQQMAYAGSVQDTYGVNLIRIWSIACLMTFVVASTFILIFAITSNFGQSFLPGSMILPFLLGAAGPLAPAMIVRRPNFHNIFRRDLAQLWPFKASVFWERVVLYDSYAGGLIWAAELPLPVLFDHLPIECRYTHEINDARWWGLGVYAGIAGLVSFVGFWIAAVPLIFSIMGTIAIVALAGIYGHRRGYARFVPVPMWTARRIEADNEEPVIKGIAHSLGTGLSQDAMLTHRIEKARSTAMEEHARQMRNQRSQPDGNPQAAPPSDPNWNRLIQAYESSVFSAHALYEEMRGLDYRDQFNDQAPKSDKIQNISMAGMALGSIGLSLVAWLIFGS